MYIHRASGNRKGSSSRSETVEDILAEMDEKMIGLDNVKEKLKSFIAIARIRTLRFERDLPADRINLHMVFHGPPGTGKTVMARKVGRLLKAVRALGRGDCVEVDRADLVASYVGQTSAKTTEVVEKALGSVLFIDEAYTLTSQGASADPFGQEAVDTLLRLMENYRDQLVVIIAGYTDAINDFIKSNDGLASRFSHYVEFPSYAGDELKEIFLNMAKENQVNIDDGALRVIERRIAEMARNGRQDAKFGNARAIRDFFETVLTAQSERLSLYPDLDSISDEELQHITEDDARLAVEKHYEARK